MKIAILAGTESKNQRFRLSFQSKKVDFVQLFLNQILNISKDREQKLKNSEVVNCVGKGVPATGCDGCRRGKGEVNLPAFRDL